MTFREDEIKSFLELFERSKAQIRKVDGCMHLELLQDMERPETLTTYSWWDSVESLQSYRESELFRITWDQAKSLFAAPPVAHSYLRKSVLD